MIELDGTRERTFEHPAGFSVTLRCPTVSELNDAQRKCGGDIRRMAAHTARHWFVGFSGLLVKGEVPPNTPEVREALLDKLLINEWVGKCLADGSRWVDEGNADGASAF